MSSVFITGGSGFFGGVLKRRLLAEGIPCVNLDLVPDADRDPRLISIQGDLRDRELVARIFRENEISSVVHCAALLAHGSIPKQDLWASNVDGTRNVAQAALAAGVRKLIFISTNCLWASNPGHAVAEDEPPAPVEAYGRSKLAAERLLAEYGGLQTVILRCPTVIDSGRLGLLAILFEFIQEGRKIWVVGNGGNRYQFIYAQDLADACLLAMRNDVAGVFHIGSDNVRPLRDVYEAVIEAAHSRSRVVSLPKGPATAAMKLAYRLGISPLGPYQYRMIAEDFAFDTTKIKQILGWRPTLTNEQMLTRAYQYYAARSAEIRSRTNVSAHSKASDMGVIRLLKWVS